MIYKEALKSLEELKCYLPSEFTEQTTSYTEALNIAIKALERLTDKPKLQPCICGRKRFKMWFQNGRMFYECPNCGRVSPPAKSQRGLVRAWNDMIQKEMRGDM